MIILPRTYATVPEKAKKEFAELVSKGQVDKSDFAN